MIKNLKLVVNNTNQKIEEKFFFEKNEIKIILNLYAKMVSAGSWKRLWFKYFESTSWF